MNAPTNTWTTPPTVAAKIAGLSDLEMPAIKSLWLSLFDADPPTHNRQFLERRIAYRLQEQAFRQVNPQLLDRNRRRIASLLATGKFERDDGAIAKPSSIPQIGTAIPKAGRRKAGDVSGEPNPQGA